jgi:hypothetical protein
MWNGFDFYYFYLDRVNRIIRNFFTCGERPFGRRPYYPNDPVDLPARAFTHYLIFCRAEQYLPIRLVGRLFLHGKRVLSNFFFKIGIHSSFSFKN